MTLLTSHYLKRVLNQLKTNLAGKGVPSSRIDAQGYGSSNPIADNSTASGREQNRRVEISIYAKQ